MTNIPGSGVISAVKNFLTPANAASTRATDLIREDHRGVEELFKEFESVAGGSGDRRTKGRIAKQAVGELKTHATLEEEIFYPALARESKDGRAVECAYEEHGLARTLLDTLERSNPTAPRFDAKFTVLMEVIRHHVREEESQLLPAAESSGLDLDGLGARMRERRAELEGRKSARRARPRRTKPVRVRPAPKRAARGRAGR